MRYVVGVCWIAVILSAVAAGAWLLFTVVAPASPDRKMAAAVICLCIAVIPYIFARSVERLWKT